MFRIRIHFLRIRILDSFPIPDPDFGSRIRIQVTKNKFFQSKNKILGEILVFNQKLGILLLFSTNQVGILLNRELLFGIIFLKISENHEKFVEKVDFYSSSSYSGSRSGFRIRIRIQSGNFNPDPPGSGSETLVCRNKEYFVGLRDALLD